MNSVLRVLALPVLAITFSSAALAQMTAQLNFAPGTDHAAANGSVTGDEYFDYVLGASAGQTLSADLSITGTNGDGIAYFNVLPPGSDGYAIFNGSMSADGTGTVELPENGDYTVRIYLMGNDRDTDKTVGYALTVTIR